MKNTNSLSGCQETAGCSFIGGMMKILNESSLNDNFLLIFHHLKVFFEFLPNIDDALVGDVIDVNNV